MQSIGKELKEQQNLFDAKIKRFADGKIIKEYLPDITEIAFFDNKDFIS